MAKWIQQSTMTPEQYKKFADFHKFTDKFTEPMQPPVKPALESAIDKAVKELKEMM